MKLKQIAAIQMGYPFRSRLERSEQGNVKVIQMKDIDESGLLRAEDLVRVSIPEIKGHHLVLPQDIIFRSRGYTTTSLLNHEDLGMTILAAPLLRIRTVSRHVLPPYINWFINHPVTQSYFASHAKGTSVPMISKKAVEEVEIPLPPIERQKKIVEIAMLAAKEQELLKRLAQRRSQYLELFLMNLAQ